MQSFTSRILSHKSLCPLVSDQHRSSWKENKFGTKFHRGGGGGRKKGGAGGEEKREGGGGGGGGGGLNNKETEGTEKLVRGGGSEEWAKNREQQCRNKVTNNRFIL